MQPPYLISMDANAHHSDWGSPGSSIDNRGRIISEWIEEQELIILNNGEPTYLANNGTHSHIDITLCSPEIATKFSWETHHDPLNSDHYPIIITDHEAQNDNISTPAPRWNIAKADWTTYQKVLKLPKVFINKTPSEVNEEVKEAILTAAGKSMPKLENLKPRPSAYFWNEECSITKRAKNRALTRYGNHLGNMEYWIEYKRCKAIFRKAMKKAREESWKKFLENFTSKTRAKDVWKHMRKLRNKPTSRSILLKVNDHYITEQKEVCNILVDNYARRSDGIYENQVFQNLKENTEMNDIIFEDNNGEDYNQPFTIEELTFALKSCISKSSGPDSLPYIFIQKMSMEQLNLMLNFYNYVYSHGYPEEWKEGDIIALHKPGKIKTSPDSYRPITLTNCLAKIIEKMVNRRLKRYLEESNFYTPYQSGFRARHSTLDGVTRLEHSAFKAIKNKKYCIATMLDISQAFDKVWHHGLLMKIKTAGLSGDLPKFIQQMLQNRRIRVKIGGEFSDWRGLGCGVPQGSVLSPTLFSIYINDIFNQVPEEVQYSLFADDGALWTTSNNLESGVETMQAALNSIQLWSNSWGLQISQLKTTFTIFTRKQLQNPPAIQMNNTEIKYTKVTKFLGVKFDQKLTWKDHIDETKLKCQKDLQLMRVIACNKFSSDYKTLKKIYTALILPKIEYASFLFGDAAKTHLTKLDRIQYEACRIILGVMKCTPTIKLEVEANILPLELRRRKQLTEYGVRVSMIPNHPIRNILNNLPTPLPRYSTVAMKKSALQNLKVELNELQLTSLNIPTIPMKHFYNRDILPFKSTLADSKKEDRVSHQWKILFNFMIQDRYPQHHQLYTDGSCKDGKTGNAVYSPSFQVLNRLPDSTSIFTAELHGIYLAIQFIIQHIHGGNFLILTNSLNVIRALQSINISGHSLMIKIYEILSQIPSGKIAIEWVPSHMGIPGNEKADQLANQATTLNYINQIPQEKSEIMKKINTETLKEWQRRWRRVDPDKTYFKREIGPTAYTEERRIDQINLTRLRLGTTRLTHAHYFTRTEPKTCRHCNVRLNLQHLLVNCPALMPARRPIIRFCQEKNIPASVEDILSPPTPAKLVLQFLNQTQMAKEI